MSKVDKTGNSQPERLNPFKLLHQVDELPPGLKEEVMTTLKYIHLASDVGKLFSIDMAKTAGKMIDPSSKEKD